MALAKIKKVDKIFFITIVSLTIVGFLIFISATLGLTARNGARFSAIVLNQLVLGLVMGSLSAFILSRLPISFFRKYSSLFFVGAIILTLAVFIPGLGFEFGGARRWLHLGPFSFQPAELLKIAYILYVAAWLTSMQKKIHTFKFGFLPWAIISGLAAIVILIQPDTDTTLVMLTAGCVMYFVAGANWKHILLTILIGIIGLSVIIAARPYIRERIMTFINPANDSLEAGYQIQQSLIAIGSGQVTGKGFGQSVQKFNFLPEPIGDSIFAVYAEEFGFIGALFLIALFVTFTVRGYKIASEATSTYASLIVIGFVTMIITQSVMNMSAMLGIIPLSGLPLLFVSHGGTALFFTLSSVGIMLGVSRNRTT